MHFVYVILSLLHHLAWEQLSYIAMFIYRKRLTLQLIVLCSDFSIKQTHSNGFEAEQSFLCSLSTALLLICFCFLLHGTIFGRRTQAPA